MARKNKLGTSFCNLQLASKDEKKLVAYLKKERMSYKSLESKLVEQFLTTVK